MQFTNWADPDKNPDRSEAIAGTVGTAFFKLLDELTIARSRKHVTRSTMTADVVISPEREKPVSIYPDIDPEDRFPSYDTLNKKIQAYTAGHLQPLRLLARGAEGKYEVIEGQKASRPSPRNAAEHFLIGMMKVNYLKRLESSVNSFQVSMDRTIVQKIDDVLKRIEEFEQRPDAAGAHVAVR